MQPMLRNMACEPADRSTHQLTDPQHAIQLLEKRVWGIGWLEMYVEMEAKTKREEFTLIVYWLSEAGYESQNGGFAGNMVNHPGRGIFGFLDPAFVMQQSLADFS